MYKKLLFLMIIVSLQSCHKENAPTEVPENSLCKLEGRVYSEYNGSITWLEGAKIKLNSDSCFTDSQGGFVFDSLSRGKYGIQIEKAGYETFNDSITIQDTAEYAEYSLNCLLVDFLPLYIGNKWDYNYNWRYDDWHSFSTISGLDKWEIVSKYFSSNITIYSVKEISDYTHHSHEYDTGFDTTWNTIDTSVFAFKEFPDSTILVQRSFYNELPPITRYNIRTDSIYFGDFELSIVLKPEKGIIRMGMYHSSIGALSVRESYTLIEEE